MPSQNPGRVPTRQAVCIDTGDRLRALVYHVDDADIFLIIDSHATPEPEDWVSIEPSNSEEVTLTLYYGQSYKGVARILEFYQLSQSEQWTPRLKVLMLPLAGLISTVLAML
jgi:hypothetical protein